MALPTVTTTHHGSPGQAKPFAWSYSKLKNFEACPKRHYHVDVLKDWREEESEQLKQGNLQHKYLAEFISHGKPIPENYRAELEPWVRRAFDWKGIDVRDRGAKVLVEQQFAITSDFSPCEWFSKQAWYRAKADVIWTLGPLGVVIDWKTGRVVEDNVQLLLTAAVMFYHYPELAIVRSQYMWLAHDADTTLDIRREDLPRYWSVLWSRIEALRHAHENTEYPPTPNRLCRAWCPVKSCPHNGDSHG